MNTENTSIDTMGFEPAVEYDVPDFGKTHVLMKDGEPWFVVRDLGRVMTPNRPVNFINFVSNYADVIEKGIKLSSRAIIVLCPAFKKVAKNSMWLFPAAALKLVAERKYFPQVRYPGMLKKLLSWVEDTFTKKEEVLQYVVKFNDLEVVFYKGKAFVTAPSLRKASGSQHTGGMFSFGKKNNKKGLIRISNAEAIALGLTGSGSGNRILATFQRAEEYLKNVCDSSSKYIVCDWLVNTVEPAAKKHLEALKAQEKTEAEAKARAVEEAKKAAAAKQTAHPTKEGSLLLGNVQTPSAQTAHAAPSYEELLSSWRTTLKAQEATLKEREAILKELEAAKKDLASRIARIDEANADIEFFVKKTNDYEDERCKLNEEIESLKNDIFERSKHIKELEDKIAYQVDLLGRADARMKDYEELHSLVSNLLEVHRGNDQDDMECYANIKGLCAAFEEWRRGYETECEEAGRIGNRLLNATLDKHVLEKQVSDAKAALATKEAELSQANAKLKEAEEKAECEHSNCDAVLAELKAEREAKAELIAKYRETVAENDYLLKNLSDRCALKLTPPYLPPVVPAPMQKI